MKKILYLAASALLLVSCNQNKTPQLDDAMDSITWVLGRSTAESLMNGPFDNIDQEVFIAAVRTTLNNGVQPISDSIYHETLAMLMHTAQAAATKQSDARSQEVDQLQDAYFAKLTAENPNVKRHPSGFYYEVLKPGTGENAKFASLIIFDYRSYTMLDGQPYDQTYGKREPITHVVGKPMFPGLIEAFQLMNKGSIYRFYFPYELAFGSQGSGDIPGYTPLIYEIELHNIPAIK